MRFALMVSPTREHAKTEPPPEVRPDLILRGAAQQAAARCWWRPDSCRRRARFPWPDGVRGGGPFLALLRRTKLLREDGRHRERPFVAMIAVTWLPIIVLATATHQAREILANLSVHARLLVSMPLLLEADLFLHELVGIAIGSFARARVAQGLDPG